MISKRIGFLTFLLWLVVPSVAFGQSWLDVSPGDVYQSPGDPSCYTITVGDGAYMTIDALFYYEGGGPYEWDGWAALDGNGQAMVCVDGSMWAGNYQFFAIRAQGSYWVSVGSSLYVHGAPYPSISNLGPTCDNGECIWITGSNFQQGSYVLIYEWNWTTHLTYWGPASGNTPGMYVSEDGASISLQLTDPTWRNWFGHDGVHVLVVNPDGTSSSWRDTQSPPPVITYAAPSCDDKYCIEMWGSFPPNTAINFRIHGQNDDLPNPYSDLTVTPGYLSLRLNPSVRYAFDTSGLDAWAVNMTLLNWSDGYYFPPVDKNITGNIDGVSVSGLQYYINGWACAKTYVSSVDVWMYVGGPAGTGTWLGGATANLASEPGVAAACNSTGTHYRFSVPIPHSITQNYGGRTIFVHGISPFGLTSYLLGNSGAFTVPSVDLSVTGFITGVVLENQQYYLRGWACAKSYSSSIDVHLYAGGPAGSGTFVTSATANQSSNPTTTAACNSGGTTYGFSILLTLALRQQFGGQAIFVHGISPFGLGNLLIGNSGNLTFPAPVATSSKEYIYIGDRLLAVDTTNLP